MEKIPFLFSVGYDEEKALNAPCVGCALCVPSFTNGYDLSSGRSVHHATLYMRCYVIGGEAIGYVTLH